MTCVATVNPRCSHLQLRIDEQRDFPITAFGCHTPETQRGVIRLKRDSPFHSFRLRRTTSPSCQRCIKVNANAETSVSSCAQNPTRSTHVIALTANDARAERFACQCGLNAHRFPFLRANRWSARPYSVPVGNESARCAFAVIPIFGLNRLSGLTWQSFGREPSKTPRCSNRWRTST